MTASRASKSHSVRRFSGGKFNRSAEFWLRAIQTYVLSDAEHELLIEVMQTLAVLDELNEIVQNEGPMTDGRVRPEVVEARQQRLVLARLIKQLDLPVESPDGEVEQFERPSTTRARKAARSRWDQTPRRP